MTRRYAPRECPVCSGTLAVSRLGCAGCGTELSGAFEPCEFCALSSEDRETLRVFMGSRGNVKELERYLGVSYPTARARLEAVLEKLGVREEAQTPRAAVLESLARGEIDVDEALGRLDERP